jgi:hypothetical protein
MTRIQHLLLFGAVMAASWCLFTYLWPRLLMSVYKRAILVQGGGDGPIPVNTLYVEPQELFADPLHPPASASKLMTTGVNRDTLVAVGWLDLRRGPLVLSVPEMDGRYYSAQFTDPFHNVVFAYVGKRTTGTRAGRYLISGPRWKGDAPSALARISSPRDSVLVIARVLVADDADLPAAYGLAKLIRLEPYAPGGATA